MLQDLIRYSNEYSSSSTLIYKTVWAFRLSIYSMATDMPYHKPPFLLRRQELDPVLFRVDYLHFQLPIDK